MGLQPNMFGKKTENIPLWTWIVLSPAIAVAVVLTAPVLLPWLLWNRLLGAS